MCLIFFLLVFEAEKKKFYYVGLPGLGLAGGQGRQGARAGRGPGLGFRFPVKWWDSLPPSGDLEPANQCAPSKSPRAPKFEKKSAPLAPIELL